MTGLPGIFSRALRTPEKIEALSLSLGAALKERRACGGNLGGALVRLFVKGRLTFAPEPPRASGKR